MARRGVERGERRSEIPLVAGHQEAALAGLGIDHRREDSIQLTEDLAGLTHGLVLVGEIARADRDDHDGQHEAGGQREREGRAVVEEPGDRAAGPPSHAGCIVGQERGPFKALGRRRLSGARLPREAARASPGNRLNVWRFWLAPPLQFCPGRRDHVLSHRGGDGLLRVRAGSMGAGQADRGGAGQ